MLQKVAVIGAGISGLTSIKACLEPECLESSHDIGGLWRFAQPFFLSLSQNDPEPERSNIYSSVIINSSKERMAFSDFPPPTELPNNMHHSVMLLYMRLYAQDFKLLLYIRFKTTMVSVSGRWRRRAETETRVFDAVIVFTGHFTHPHLPLKDFPGARNIFIRTTCGKTFTCWPFCLHSAVHLIPNHLDWV
uniref:Flavin-containing monooxygenase n=1 Tax=Sparus aurata TaxID=8175 RepID=A0A671V0V9_SPAAU